MHGGGGHALSGVAGRGRSTGHAYLIHRWRLDGAVIGREAAHAQSPSMESLLLLLRDDDLAPLLHPLRCCVRWRAWLAANHGTLVSCRHLFVANHLLGLIHHHRLPVSGSLHRHHLRWKVNILLLLLLGWRHHHVIGCVWSLSLVVGRRTSRLLLLLLHHLLLLPLHLGHLDAGYLLGVGAPCGGWQLLHLGRERYAVDGGRVGRRRRRPVYHVVVRAERGSLRLADLVHAVRCLACCHLLLLLEVEQLRFDVLYLNLLPLGCLSNKEIIVS